MIVTESNIDSLGPGSVVLKDGVAWTKNNGVPWKEGSGSTPEWYGLTVANEPLGTDYLARRGNQNFGILGGTILHKEYPEPAPVTVGMTFTATDIQKNPTMVGVVVRDGSGNVGIIAIGCSTWNCLGGSFPLQSDTYYTVVYIPENLNPVIYENGGER